MGGRWAQGAPGVLVLPSGRSVRGRALRRPVPDGPEPEVGLYLLRREPGPFPWAWTWLRWPDFRLPLDRAATETALRSTWQLAGDRRVEIACAGGVGRTGTALACLAVLDGVPPAEAVAFVRAGFHPRAVETPWQRRYVERFGTAAG